MIKKYDIIIIGGGPVGLCAAASVASLGLDIAIVEKQSLQNLAAPNYDGRDIAITHISRKILTDLGIWLHIPEDAVSTIQQAKVLNGASTYALDFNALDVKEEHLAFIVSNHLIRKAAFDNLKRYTNVSFITDVTALHADSNSHAAFLTLSNGTKISCNLLIAADSRFSSIRQQMGISAKIDDFGKTIIVFQMSLEKAHHNIAYECFYYGSTLAVLPLCNNKCSIVITNSPEQNDRLLTMSAEQLNAEIETRFSSKYGKMQLVSQRFSYPLISVYANKFVGKCFALIGDAAVGMHPVTAHGFNFGVKGQYNLANEIKNAIKRKQHIGSRDALMRYEQEHVKATKPLYMATNLIAKLFTNDDLKSRCARNVFLRAANNVTPIKKLILSTLTEKNMQNHAISPLRFLLSMVGI